MGRLLKSAWGSPSTMLKMKMRTTMTRTMGRRMMKILQEIEGKKPGEDYPEFEHDVQVVDDDLAPSRCWTHSQEAQQAK